jgi:hypothetical protein
VSGKKRGRNGKKPGPPVHDDLVERDFTAESRIAVAALDSAVARHGINLKTNPSPPADEQVRELLARGQEMLWRRWDDDDGAWLTAESWPIRAN